MDSSGLAASVSKDLSSWFLEWLAGLLQLEHSVLKILYTNHYQDH